MENNMSTGGDVYFNKITQNIIEYRFKIVPGITADTLYAALANGSAEIYGNEVLGPDGFKLADVKTYRKNYDGKSIWMRLDEYDPLPSSIPQASPVDTNVPSETKE